MLAARPKTLAAAAAPVAIACALAYSDGAFRPEPAFLCMLFALIMQVDANFINDLFDCLKGSDGEGRLGPDRACAKGWITTGAMRLGIAAATAAACLAGLGLLRYGGAWLAVVGAACVLFAFLYTAGPKPLSYCAMGDALVFVFFGLVPVCCTYYVTVGGMTLAAAVSAAACGLAVDTLLALNNYRDLRQDAKNGKRTLTVLLGERGGIALYLWLGAAAWAATLPLAALGKPYAPLLACIYLFFHIRAWKTMREIGSGRALNRVLAMTSRNILIFAAALSAGFALGR